MYFKFAGYAVMNLVVTAVVHSIGVVRFVEYTIEGTP
jgi:hypothetical protein